MNVEHFLLLNVRPTGTFGFGAQFVSIDVGVDYKFTVVVSKGVSGGLDWRQLRSAGASCVVSTHAGTLPYVSIEPKVSATLRRLYRGIAAVWLVVQESER